MPRRLLTNEHEEAVLALEFTAGAAQALGSNAYLWKWVIVGMHNALQGLMVLALRGGNGLAALPDALADEWLKAYRAGTTRPIRETRQLLEPVPEDQRQGDAVLRPQSPVLAAGSQGRSMEMLNRLRNDFIHFLPQTWSLELVGLPNMCLDCLAVGEFLINASFGQHFVEQGIASAP